MKSKSALTDLPNNRSITTMTRLVLSAAVVASAALLSADSAAAFNPTSDRRAALADVAKLLGGAVAAGTVLPQQASAGLNNPVSS